VALGKAIGAKALDLLEAALGEFGRIAARAMPEIILSRNPLTSPARLKVAMARRS